MIVMGSLGSSSVNDLMKEALNGIDPSLQVLYVCGKQNPADPKDFPEHVIVQDFVNTTKIYPFWMVSSAGLVQQLFVKLKRLGFRQSSFQALMWQITISSITHPCLHKIRLL